MGVIDSCTPPAYPRLAFSARSRAWIEEGSGRPVKLEFSIAPLPRRFRRVNITYDYRMQGPDRWVLKSVTISGQGGFLFIKRYFTVATTFSEYRRRPAATRLRRTGDHFFFKAQDIAGLAVEDLADLCGAD
jgi:hypothetical protein